MEPTLRDGDLVAIARARGEPRRGSVALVDTGDLASARWQIKRVVGLPGDRLELRDGLLYVNGSHHPEPYLNGLPAYLGTEAHSWELAAGECFLLGDNRVHSSDSRRYGPVSTGQIAGVVFARLWPRPRFFFSR